MITEQVRAGKSAGKAATGLPAAKPGSSVPIRESAHTMKSLEGKSPPPAVTLALGIALLAVAGWLDYVTGPAVIVFPLYLLPVAVTAWFLGRLAGLVMGVASTAVTAENNDALTIR